MSDNTMIDEYVCERETLYKDVWYPKGRKLFVPAGTDVNNCNFKPVKVAKKARSANDVPSVEVPGK